jgi:hypothetical protein
MTDSAELGTVGEATGVRSRWVTAVNQAQTAAAALLEAYSRRAP